MHQYIYIKIYTLRAFQIFEVSCGSYLYKGTLTFILLPLLNCDLFTLSVQILVTLSLPNCDLFTLGVQILVTWHQKLCEGWQLDLPTYYCFRCIVDFVVLLVYYSVCVDRSGSLSGGAFNQLKLVTLSIVLTILYLLKTVLQRSLLQCLNSLYKSNEVF